MTPRRAFLFAVVGVLLVQAAWVLALPAFRGIDEIDHVYRTEALLHGQLSATEPAPEGRGALVVVPDDVVEAAGPACRGFSYMKRDNCRAVEQVSPGLVTVASSAANYNPSYYAVVGQVARPFHGEGVAYALRAFSALLCALLIGLAFATTARWARNAWPFVALVVALTPTFTYSTSVVSPNGPHYAAALLAWTAAIGLVAQRDRDGIHLLHLALAGVVLLGTHSTGPMWLALIGLVTLALRPLRWWYAGRRLLSRAWVLAALALVVAGLANVGWTVLSGANRPGAADPDLHPVRLAPLVGEMVLWVLQTIAAFPMRDNPAPAAVYAIYLPLLLVGLVAAFRRAGRRTRLVLAGIVVADFLVPSVLTVLTFASLGFAWQGRYSLPLTLGLAVVGGWVLSERGTSPRPRTVAVVGAAVAVTVGVSAVNLALVEIHGKPGTPLSGELPGGVLLVGLLAVAGTLAPLLLTRHTIGPDAPAPTLDAPERVAA